MNRFFFALRDSRITCYAADIELRCWTLPSGCSCTEHNSPFVRKEAFPHHLICSRGPPAHLCHLKMSVIFLFFSNYMKQPCGTSPCVETVECVWMPKHSRHRQESLLFEPHVLIITDWKHVIQNETNLQGC